MTVTMTTVKHLITQKIIAYFQVMYFILYLLNNKHNLECTQLIKDSSIRWVWDSLSEQCALEILLCKILNKDRPIETITFSLCSYKKIGIRKSLKTAIHNKTHKQYQTIEKTVYKNYPLSQNSEYKTRCQHYVFVLDHCT